MHVCTTNEAVGMTKYGFLWPSGTLFKQNNFICDWWFNAQREALTSDALGGSGAPADYAAASAPGDCSVEDDMFSQYMDHLGSQPLLICVNIELPSYKTPKKCIRDRRNFMSIWGLSTFHILLLKSDKQPNHLEKKKNVKNMKININGKSLTYDR